MTELRCALIGRGLVQSLSRSSLRMQGPITPGLKSEKSLCSSAETRVRAVWVPAFAGTTCWKIPYAIALPQAGRGEGSELIFPDEAGEKKFIKPPAGGGPGGWKAWDGREPGGPHGR